MKNINLSTYNANLLQSKVHRILHLKTAVALRAFRIAPPYWIMLGVVYESRDGMRLTDIANAMGVKKSLVTRMIDKLESDKLLVREGSSHDKRAKRVYLTAEGKRLVPTIEKSVREKVKYLAENISNADMAAYMRVMVRIVDNFEGAKRRSFF